MAEDLGLGMAEGRPLRTVFLGDSITAGGDWEAWFPEYETHNLGISGDTSDGVLARIKDVVDLAPGIVSLLIGTNDLSQGRSPEYIARNLELLLSDLRRRLPDVGTLVQSIMPRGATLAADIQEVNRHVQQFAEIMHWPYLDLWPALGTEEGDLKPEFTRDGLHLTSTGYEAWIATLRPAFEIVDGAPQR